MANKKSKYLIIIIICIVTLLLYFKRENLFSNKEIDPTNFAVENTENISKVIMSDKKGDKIIMEKKDNQWFINNKYKIWDIRIDYLLEVLKDIKVKSSVPLKKQNTVIKNIATTGVKIEIFEKNNLTKTYFIGTDDTDNLGTYMIMKGASEPYLMYIPTQNPAILNPKYVLETNYVNEQLWREPITISIDKKEIHSIKVEDIKQEESSFTLDTRNNKLYDYKEKEVDALSEKLQDFIISFNKLECGVYKPKLKSSDFILIKKIYIQKENSIDSLIIYDKTELQNTTKEHNTSVENLYAQWNNSDLVIIQKNIFNKVLITISELKE